MSRKVSNEEFVGLWNELMSPQLVAEASGLTIRNVYQRRNNLEAKGYALPSVSTKASGERRESSINAARQIISARRDVNRLEIESGIIVVGSDAHYSPGHIPVAHKAMCNLLVDLGTEVKAVVLNGDIFDGGQASRHPRIRWKKAPSVKDELQAVQDRLGEIESVRAPGCKLMRTYGNHCARFETRLSNQVPEFEGVPGFTLREHLPFWEDSERIDVNEDCVLIHDWHSGVHSGYNDALKGGCHVITGHTHELGVKTVRGFKQAHYGIKTGMLADEWQEEFDYRNGKPGFNWTSGFAVLTWKDGMMLYPEFATVREDGRCYFRGRLYAD